MVEAILERFEFNIDDITVIPSRGGVFEVVAGDQVVFSKKELGRHADIDEVIETLATVINARS